ncbi:MAG: hypothetical protein AAF726_24540 [Planctomycetota bacterium]
MLSALLVVAAGPLLPQAELVPVPVRSRRRSALQGPGSSAATVGGQTSAGPAAGRPDVRIPPPNDYSIATFGYTDPNDPDFNALGGGSFSVLRQDESILIPYSGTLERVRREDEPSNYATSDSALNHGTSNGDIYILEDAGMGDFLGDGKKRAVTVSRVFSPFGSNNRRAALRIWESEDQPVLFPLFEIATDYAVESGVDLAVGDVDADGRDEIILSVQRISAGDTRVIVVDDAVEGDWTSGAAIQPLVDREVHPSHVHVLVACGQFDGDAAEETVALRPFSTSQSLTLYDDATEGLALLAAEAHAVPSGADTIEGEHLVAFDYDGDGRDSVASYSRGRLYVSNYDVDAQQLSRFGDSRSLTSLGPIALTAFDVDGNGREQLAFIDTRLNDSPFGGLAREVEIDALEFRESGVWEGRNLVRLGIGLNDVLDANLVALDDDGDGREELRAAVGRMSFGGTPSIFEFNYDGDVLYTNTTSVSYDFVLGEKRLALVAGDDDGESVVVRWTGEKYLNLSQPMPIALMEAVPTKFGIGQNYAASGSTFTQGASGTTSFATTASTTVSGTVGVSSPSLFEDVFGASASTTISGQVSRTTGIESSVRSFVTYGGAYDAHTIVFQGTLYTSYLYEVVRARPQHPNAVGTTIALNVPVATGAWKWELDFFNQVFPQGAIDPAVAFGHSSGATNIGDPSSYVDRVELQGYVSGAGHAYDGWIGNSTNVGQGSSAITVGLELASQSSTSTERTFGVEATAGVQIGPYSFDGSVGLTDGTIYSVATAEDTSYTATIGDIASTSEWSSWSYAAGMVVYQERDAFFAPVQVMRYWVDAFGSAY